VAETTRDVSATREKKKKVRGRKAEQNLMRVKVVEKRKAGGEGRAQRPPCKKSECVVLGSRCGMGGEREGFSYTKKATDLRLFRYGPKRL